MECQPREGLPNVLAKLQAGGAVRIAYLGGSITEAAGWRVLSREWLAKQYPKATVTEIGAAISGTGAEFGSCRLQRHVLDHDPDLLFVEFAVNGIGRGDRGLRTMEGIVRQTWQRSPSTDICFVYTISSRSLKDVQAGKNPAVVQTMERVAAAYGVPSIHLGLEVARKEKAGTLVFRGAPPAFSRDGVHPDARSGHPFYLAAIARSMPLLKAAGTPGAHPLPAPLDANNWEKARMLPVGQAKRSGDWAQVPFPGDPKRAQRVGRYLSPLWRASRPGDALSFTFRGTAFGIVGLKGPDAGQFAVTVDDRPPVVGALFDGFCTEARYRMWPWLYPQDLPFGEHRVTITLLPEPIDKESILKRHRKTMRDPKAFAPNWLYIGDVLVVGEVE